MKMTLISSMILLASMAFVNADIDGDSYRNYLLANDIWNANQRCVSYGQNCNNAPCCRYPGQSRLECLSGVCTHTVCGYPGQRCGYNIGECCYSQGLYCNYQYNYVGTCVFTKVAV